MRCPSRGAASPSYSGLGGDGGLGSGTSITPRPPCPALCPALIVALPLGYFKRVQSLEVFSVSGWIGGRRLKQTEKKKKKEVKSAQVVLGLKALLMFLQAELQVFAWESGSEID